MLEPFKLEQFKTVKTPYRSGLKIDCIKHDKRSKSEKERFIQEYQSIIGCFNWLSKNTSLDINTVYSLLRQFNSNPLPGHMEATKTSCDTWNIPHHMIFCFKQDENRLQGCCAIHKELQEDELLLFIDSNWDPQDSSKPIPN